MARRRSKLDGGACCAVLEHDWGPMQERLHVILATARTALLDCSRGLDGPIDYYGPVGTAYFTGTVPLSRDPLNDEHDLLEFSVSVRSDVPWGPVKASLVFNQGDPGLAVFEMWTRDEGLIGRVEHRIRAGATTSEISIALSDFVDVVEAALPVYTAMAIRFLAEEPKAT